MKIYSIHDAAAGFFIAPFTAHNDALAKRMFIGSLGDSFPHRADFTLHCLGVFDDQTGEITFEPSLILNGLSIDVSLDPRLPFIKKENDQ